MHRLGFQLISLFMVLLTESAVFADKKGDCTDATHELIGIVGQYYNDSQVHDRSHYQTDVKWFQTFFAEQKRTGCYETVANAYALTSLYFATLFSASNQSIQAPLLKIFSLLQSEKRILPLSEKLRNDLKGKWMKKIVVRGRERYALMGGYDCEKTFLYYDPSILPYNLGAVLIHEFDHFLRDKIRFGTKWAMLSEKNDLKKTYIMDEVVANLMGVTAQFRLWHDSTPKLKSYQKLDFTFFDEHGILAKIWENAADSVKPYGPFQEYLNVFTSASAVPSLSLYVDSVLRHYFPESKLNPQALTAEIADLLKNQFSPLLLSLSDKETAIQILPDEWREISTGCTKFSQIEGSDIIRPSGEGVRGAEEITEGTP